MNNKKWSVIVNPNAGNGCGERYLPLIEKLFTQAGLDYSLYFTKQRFHAIEITRDIISKGANNLICVGGDDTLNEVVNGVFTQNHTKPDEILLALLPVGAGNDWCRTHKIPFDYEKVINLLSQNKTMLHDIGKVSFSEGAIQQPNISSILQEWASMPM